MTHIILALSFIVSATLAEARSFTRSDTSQEFCKDIISNLREVGVSASERSMTACSLQVLGGAQATFERPTGDPMNVTVKSNPYRMFVTRGDSKTGTCYVLHPRKVTRKVTDRDC